MPRPTSAAKRIGGNNALVVAFALTAAACVPAGHLQDQKAAVPVFDPIRFFAGRTEGRGSLAILFRHREPTLVTGVGMVGPDQSIVLDQDVRRGNGKPTHRTWRLRRGAGGLYTGTINDAVGPVEGQVKGNCLHLRFAMRGGLYAQQWLYMQPSGQVVHNRMVVTKLGIPVASLDETITREPS